MVWLTATFLCTIAFGSTASPPTSLPPLVETAVRESQALPLHDRIDVISKSLLGRTYRLDPMGEGVLPDTATLVQYEALD